jgi:DNA-binding CsgD family transcriptional regulator
MRCSDVLPRLNADPLSEFIEYYNLSARQQEVLALVVRGLRSIEIGNLLGISANTVRNTLVDIFRKTHVTTRSELVYIAISFRGAACHQLEAQRALVVAAADPQLAPSGADSALRQPLRQKDPQSEPTYEHASDEGHSGQCHEGRNTRH